MKSDSDQLALAQARPLRPTNFVWTLNQEQRTFLELVTPTTADLLAWWFSEDMVMARSSPCGRGLFFHSQRPL